MQPFRTKIVNLRAYYRVVFPIGGRPWLQVGDHICPVLDCSERGLHIAVDPGRRPAVDEVVEGKLRLPTGDELWVTGVVLRPTAEGVALCLLEEGIPFGTMLRLQIHLRRRFWLADGDPAAPELMPPVPGAGG